MTIKTRMTLYWNIDMRSMKVCYLTCSLIGKLIKNNKLNGGMKNVKIIAIIESIYAVKNMKIL